MHHIGFDEQAMTRPVRAVGVDHRKRLSTEDRLCGKMAVDGGVADGTRPESIIVPEAKSAVPVGRFGHWISIAGLSGLRNGLGVNPRLRGAIW